MSTLPPGLNPQPLRDTADLVARAQATLADMQTALVANPDHQSQWVLITLDGLHAEAMGSGTTRTAVFAAITALEYALRHAEQDLWIETTARLNLALSVLNAGRLNVDAVLVPRQARGAAT